MNSMPIPGWTGEPSGESVFCVQATRPRVSIWWPSGRLNSNSRRLPAPKCSDVQTKAPPRETFAHVSDTERKKGWPLRGSRSGSMLESVTMSFASIRGWRRRWWLSSMLDRSSRLAGFLSASVATRQQLERTMLISVIRMGGSEWRSRGAEERGRDDRRVRDVRNSTATT